MKTFFSAFIIILLMFVSRVPADPGDETHLLGPDSLPQPGTPQGKVTAPTTLPSQVYPGTIRNYRVYVPARNTIFLSYALAWAEVLNCQDVFIGVNAVDFSGYPDCRPEFISAFDTMANLATKMTTESGRRFQIHAPLIQLTKAQIIRKGIELGVDYGLTHSCYDPNESGRACGRCDSCLLRKKGFAEASMDDPTRYI